MVNVINNIYQTRTVYTNEELEEKADKFHGIKKIDRMIENMNCVPRPGPKGNGPRNKARMPWDFKLSVFSAYKADTA